MHVCTLMRVHHASLLLCVLSAFQRACFCAGTDDAAATAVVTTATSPESYIIITKEKQEYRYFTGFVSKNFWKKREQLQKNESKTVEWSGMLLLFLGQLRV